MAIPRAAKTQRRTRIQEEKEEVILEAALDVFSMHGFKGATSIRLPRSPACQSPTFSITFAPKEAMPGR